MLQTVATPYLQHDPFKDLARLFYTCDTTLSYMWHDSNHMCDTTFEYIWHDSFTHVTWLFHTCDMTLTYMWHDSGHMCDTTFAYTWYDSVICVPRTGSVIRVPRTESVICVTRTLVYMHDYQRYWARRTYQSYWVSHDSGGVENRCFDSYVSRIFGESNSWCYIYIGWVTANGVTYI